MTWVTGQQLGGKYTIERELGRGRVGITYLAKDRSGNNFVIKTLNEDVLNQLSQSDRQRLESDFMREILKLKEFQHPHIVRVYDIFKEGQQSGIAMEYIAGVTLGDRAQPILPQKEALGYIQQIGEALIEVHRQGLVHRDVKPENIIVRAGKNEVVLIDFDLARDFDNPLTSRGLKSDGFAPIEMYSKKLKRGAWTDIYSLAATLYVLLTGQKPPSALDRKDGTQLESPKKLNPQISDRVERAILQGMRLEPEARPQTMRAWLNLLGLKPVIPVWMILVAIGVILAIATSIAYTFFKWDAVTFWTAVGAIATLLSAILAAIAYFKPPLR
ncbi:MAG TPA: serine/threonine protein kinase [Cyanobacteria bacterium UBA11372]|nr:serine/threonine protein kinase [Cyanobacteria bacterium UBA11372]